MISVHHIVPKDDCIIHSLEVSCPCEPTMMVFDNKLLTVHNSMDQREQIEKLTGLSTQRGWVTVKLKDL